MRFHFFFANWRRSGSPTQPRRAGIACSKRSAALATTILLAITLHAALSIAADATAPNEGSSRQLYDHTFQYTPATGAATPASVTIAGDFNGWNATQDKLSLSGGHFQITLHLPAGVHAYKFVVDGKWTNDPNSDTKLDQPDGLGGLNSGVSITPAGAAADAKSAGGLIDHTFEFVPPTGAHPKSVTVAGDFNGWNTTDSKLDQADGKFHTTLGLKPGVHQYKFLVDGVWTNDPNSDPKLDQPDGNGGNNSGVQIGPATPPSPPAPADAKSAAGLIDHTFEFTPPTGTTPQSVTIAGDFNGWNTTATKLDQSDGKFHVTLHLSPGVHQYKFLIDGVWTNDPNSDAKLDQPDGNGGKNSGVLIGPQ